jgi:hypothetical protein
VDGRTGLPQLLSRGIDFEIAEAEIQKLPPSERTRLVHRITGLGVPRRRTGSGAPIP